MNNRTWIIILLSAVAGCCSSSSLADVPKPVPELVRRGLPGMNVLLADRTALSLWVSVLRPSGLLAGGNEGVSEIDVVIETSSWVWFIEAKYRSNISAGTTTRPLRDQVLRNIDVGSYYAGVRDFFFTLLIDSVERSPVGAQTVSRYADLATPRSLLAGHRPDGLMNVNELSSRENPPV
jgi:hypothetical protein